MKIKLSASGKLKSVDKLAIDIEFENLPKPVREYHYAKPRRWRFDFAWPERKIAIEVEGGTFGRPVKCHYCGEYVKQKLKNGRWIQVRVGGRHSTGDGMDKDMEKYNTAAKLGWRVFRFSTKAIENGNAIKFLTEIFNND